MPSHPRIPGISISSPDDPQYMCKLLKILWWIVVCEPSFVRTRVLTRPFPEDTCVPGGSNVPSGSTPAPTMLMSILLTAYLNLKKNCLGSEYRTCEHWIACWQWQQVFGTDNHYIQDEGCGQDKGLGQGAWSWQTMYPLVVNSGANTGLYPPNSDLVCILFYLPIVWTLFGAYVSGWLTFNCIRL